MMQGKLFKREPNRLVTMCFDNEIPEKKNQKNKFALDEEDLEHVEPELEQVQGQPMVSSMN